MSSWWFAVPYWMVMFLCFLTTLSSSKCCNYGIGLPSVSWRGRGNLQSYCPQFCGNQTLCRSHRLYSWDPAEHLHFVNLCNFRTLDRFKRSWLATAAYIWNGLPADLILQGEACGWRTILKDVQHCICTWFVQLCVYVWGYYSKKKM